MKIKVKYQMSNIEKALWSVTRKFTTQELEPAPQMITVRGLKPTPKAEANLDNWMDCKAQTGLTESEYQAKHHYAWSE